MNEWWVIFLQKWLIFLQLHIFNTTMRFFTISPEDLRESSDIYESSTWVVSPLRSPRRCTQSANARFRRASSALQMSWVMLGKTTGCSRRYWSSGNWWSKLSMVHVSSVHDWTCASASCNQTSMVVVVRENTRAFIIRYNFLTIREKEQLGTLTAGAHLPTPWLFEPAKRLDDKADYCPC